MTDFTAVLVAGEGDDRLSQLGDRVLGHILSFLPSFEAARAAALSRRWRDVFAAVHTVSLDQRARPVPDGGGFWPVPTEFPPFGDVVSAALLARQRRGGGVPLRELRVSFGDLCGLNAALVDQFLSCAMQQAGDDLHLDLRLRGGTLCSLCRRRSEPEGDDEPYTEPCATCGGHLHDDEEENQDTASPASPPADAAAHPRAIPAPRRVFSCAALRSLCLGPCRLDDLPAAIDLPCLETLLLTGVAGEQVQRLVTACPRLADLTLEACARLATLSVLDSKHLRRLALRCCHALTAVATDATGLRVLEYRGVVPAPSFLTMRGPRLISSCTLDFCGGGGDGEEPSDPSELRGFLELFAGANHLHIKSTRIGSAAAGLPPFTGLRHLELTGISSDDDNTVVPAVTRILERTPSLETLSLFFLPEPEKNVCDKDYEATLDLHELRYNRYAALAVPDGGEIPCLRRRMKEINLVHYQGAVSQRMLAKFLLRSAPLLEELCCALAPGPLWMQAKLLEEMKDWAVNKSARIMFV
ncbi:hypothetical protein ACP4OV_004271 [Aristida adscensionis]